MSTNAGRKPTHIKADMVAFIHDAFEGIGEQRGLTGIQAFTEWASNPANQSQFYTQIWAKLIPKDIKSEISGANGGPVKMSISWMSGIEDAILPETLDVEDNHSL
jgi:hypothetical protein